MLINYRKKSQISKVLFRIYKKLSRFNLGSKNFYLLLLFLRFFHLDNDSTRSLDSLWVSEIKNKKYYYLLIFLLMKNYIILWRKNHDLDLAKVRPCLIYKNKELLIYLENNYHQGNYLNLNHDFFLRRRKFQIFLHEQYKFRIDLFSFLFYGKYIEYIRKSVYNEYLTFISALSPYPLLKTFLRLIVYKRLDKLQDSDLNNSSNDAIFRLYNIYDDEDHFHTNDSQLVWNNYDYSKDLISSMVNSHLIKFLIIWRNKKFYFYLDYIFTKFIKFNFILPAYHINLFYEEEEDATDTNKLNMMGVYSLYWQMNRYGFEFNYYYYMNSLVLSILNNNLNNINTYNLYYLKFILSNKINTYWIYWYKLIKLILLDFIYKSFFKFIKSNTLKLRRKKLRFKRLLSFKYIIQTYSFILLPLNLDLYYNDNFLLKVLEKRKNFIEEIILNIFTGFDLDLSYNLNFSLINIYKKINLDNILFNNIDFFMNIYIFFIFKYIGKYYFQNSLAQFKGIECFLLKLLKLKKNIISKSKDLYLLKSRKYLNFNLSENQGINIFHTYRHLFINEYLWDFEFRMIYSFYLIILFKYNQLYLQIFIGKFLLYGIN